MSVVYFHCKTIRNAANITASFEKSHSKISHFRPQKSEKSPAKSCRDWIIHRVAFLSSVALALSHWEWRTYFYLDTLDWSWALYLTGLPADGNIAQNVALFIITLSVVRPHLDQGFQHKRIREFFSPKSLDVHDACQTSDWEESELDR